MAFSLDLDYEGLSILTVETTEYGLNHKNLDLDTWCVAICNIFERIEVEHL